MNNSKLQRSVPRRAFTLIETVLALGIISTGMLLLFALVPTALTTMGDSAKKSVERRIANNIIGELMLNQWGVLYSFDGQMRYFDSQGLELDMAGSPTPVPVFSVHVVVSPRDVRTDHDGSLTVLRTTKISGWAPPYTFPEDPLTPAIETVDLNLRRIVVEITAVPGVQTASFFTPANADLYRTYASVVANMTDSDTPFGP